VKFTTEHPDLLIILPNLQENAQRKVELDELREILREVESLRKKFDEDRRKISKWQRFANVLLCLPLFFEMDT